MHIERNSVFKVIIGTAAVIIILFGINQASSFVATVALAFFLAVVIYPIIAFFARFKIPSIVTVIILFIIVFYGLSWFIQQLISSIINFSSEIPRYTSDIVAYINHLQQLIKTRFDIDLSTKFINLVRSPDFIKFATSSASSFSNSLTSVFNTGITILLILIFLLIDAIKFRIRVLSATDARNISYLVRVYVLVKEYMIKKFYISLATALVTFIALKLFFIPFAIIWTTLVFMMNFIPTIGSIIATIPIIAMIIINSLQLEIILLQSAIIIGIQLFFGNFIEPKVFSASLDLSASIVIIGLLAFGYILGLIGVFLTLPILISIKIFLEAFPEYRKIAYLISENNCSYQQYASRLELVDQKFSPSKLSEDITSNFKPK